MQSRLTWTSGTIATSVEMATGRTVFYGKDLNHTIRGWYFWLGLKKAIDAIKG